MTFTPRALAVPVRIDATGAIAFVQDDASIVRQRVLSAIGTQTGERVMRPNFGTRLTDALYEPSSPEIEADISQSISDAVSTLVPEVVVREVSVVWNDSGSSYDVGVRYVLTNGSEGSVKTAVAAGTGGF